MAYTIKAERRNEIGKSRMRRMRGQGTVPAVMYGHGDPSEMLAVNAHEMGRLVDEIRGSSPIVELVVDGQPLMCVIKTLQRNPTNDQLLHIDFQKVHPTEKITMNVPVIVHGTPEGVKSGGMLEHLLREVPVRTTIDKIPQRFELDVTPLKLGQSIHISDLKTEGVDFAIPLETAVVTVLVPRKLTAAQMEAEKVAAAAAAVVPGEAGAEEPKQPEVIREKKPAEGEEAAAGAEEKGKDKGKEKEKGKEKGKEEKKK